MSVTEREHFSIYQGDYEKARDLCTTGKDFPPLTGPLSPQNVNDIRFQAIFDLICTLRSVR